MHKEIFDYLVELSKKLQSDFITYPFIVIVGDTSDIFVDYCITSVEREVFYNAISAYLDKNPQVDKYICWVADNSLCVVDVNQKKSYIDNNEVDNLIDTRYIDILSVCKIPKSNINIFSDLAELFKYKI